MTTITSRCPHCNKKNRVPSERVQDKAACGACKKALFDGKPVAGNAGNLNALMQADKPVVIDFWAPWCGPCRSFAPVFEQAAAEREGKARFVKVDTEAEQMLGAQYQIRSIPTLMVFKNGKMVEQLSGALPKAQFDQWLDQALRK